MPKRIGFGTYTLDGEGNAVEDGMEVPDDFPTAEGKRDSFDLAIEHVDPTRAIEPLYHQVTTSFPVGSEVEVIPDRGWDDGHGIVETVLADAAGAVLVQFLQGATVSDDGEVRVERTRLVPSTVIRLRET